MQPDVDIEAKKKILRLYLEAPVHNCKEFFAGLKGVSYQRYLELSRSDQSFANAWLVANQLKRRGRLDEECHETTQLYPRLIADYKAVIDQALAEETLRPYLKAAKKSLNPDAITYSRGSRSQGKRGI